MNYYAALDVSLRSVHLCIIDENGEIQAEGQVDSEAVAIDEFLRKLGLEITSVGLEAGTLTQYLTYGLQAACYEVICMEARQVKAALSAMRNKTDKNDARGIAQLLRSGWYSRVHVKSIESHYIRMLLSSRKAVLNKCIDLENEIRGLFKVFGISCQRNWDMVLLTEQCARSSSLIQPWLMPYCHYSKPVWCSITLIVNWITEPVNWLCKTPCVSA